MTQYETKLTPTQIDTHLFLYLFQYPLNQPLLVLFISFALVEYIWIQRGFDHQRLVARYMCKMVMLDVILLYERNGLAHLYPVSLHSQLQHTAGSLYLPLEAEGFEGPMIH